MMQPEILSRPQSLPGSIPTDRVRPVSPVSLGQPVHARVDSLLPDGRFRISVGDHPMVAQMPPGTQPGQNMALVLITQEPEPRFALAASPGAASTVSLALSAAAQLVRALEQTPPEVRPMSAGPLVKVADMEMDSTAVARGLREGLSGSGLFYESHQAQWLTGQHGREQLLREPQGRLPVGNGLADTAMTEKGEGASGAAPRLLAHPDTLPIIRLQLDAIENRQVAWHGEVWPGQWLEWEVAQLPQHDVETPAGEPQWETRVHLDLPRIGRVDAAIRLTPHGIRLSVQASEQATAELLRNRAPDLIRTLEAHALPVLGLVTHHHDRS